MVVIWFILIRPQQKKQKVRTELLRAVEVGDDVVTVGGLHGRIVELADDHMDLLVTEGIVLRYQRDALMKVVGEEPDEPAEDDDVDDDVDEE
jgi:preprotein translocase subunit YajC